jgi:hypothetical protein
VGTTDKHRQNAEEEGLFKGKEANSASGRCGDVEAGGTVISLKPRDHKALRTKNM